MSETAMKVALVGNPNSGKTSIFNALTGSRQKVGNFPGITVEKKTGKVKYEGIQIEFIDLPGTYSLSPFSADERVVRDFLLSEEVDLVINVIDSGNLERSLYLTTQLMEMGLDIIIDLNMWDDTVKYGWLLNEKELSKLTGAAVVKTNGKTGEGIRELFEKIYLFNHNKIPFHHHPSVHYGSMIEDLVVDIAAVLKRSAIEERKCRWLAVKMMEDESGIVEKYYPNWKKNRRLSDLVEKSVKHVEDTSSMDVESAFEEGRYGFIEGLLKQVEKKKKTDRMKISKKIDAFLTHRFLGYPVFLFLMWLIFECTFAIGAYPMEWIEEGVGFISVFLARILPAGMFADLIIDGLIGGVGSVIVFLPNIVILFLGISLLEDSGYMARAAFLMDKLMKSMGLHGKAFVPMLMGFGCTVPAIMATRTLESQKQRILTTLMLPYMSCGARLPVYLLIAGAFFGADAGRVIFLIYIIGVLFSVLFAKTVGKMLIQKESVPFILELPPYRIPTLKSVLIHVVERSKIYLKKMGGVILIASFVLWFLGNFPVKKEFSRNYDLEIETLKKEISNSNQKKIDNLEFLKKSELMEYSFIGRLGKVMEPVFEPLGYNWKMGVSLCTGLIAKEVVVSTLGVLYHLGDETDEGSMELKERLKEDIQPLAAWGFMIFVLLYTPCVAAIAAVKHEIGKKWMAFSVAFQLISAWLVALLVYQIPRIL